MRNSEPLALDVEGLTPDDPHAPRRYGRDPYADDDRLQLPSVIHKKGCCCEYCDAVHFTTDDLVS
jgi:hypothetical protein